MALVLAFMPAVETRAATYPKVMITSATVDDSELIITIANMSSNTNVSDVLVSFAENDDIVLPAEGKSNQAYISDIKAGYQVEITFPVTINGAGKSAAKVDFDIQYAVPVGEGNFIQQSNKASISLDLTTAKNSLAITNLSIPREGYLYEKGLLSFTYSNSSAEDINDLKVTVTGLNNGTPQTYSIGNVKTKKSGYFETYLDFNTSGNREVGISYSYTTATGEEVSSSDIITYISVSERIVAVPDVSVQEDQSEVAQSTGFNMGYVFIGIAGLLVVICAILAITSARKNK